MITYFELQYKRLNRSLSAFGLNPYLGLLLLGAFFILFSKLSYTKLLQLWPPYAPYLYALLPLAAVYTLGNKSRNNFLKNIFTKKRYLQLRLLENSLIALPFYIFLMCMQQFLPSLVAVAGSLSGIFIQSVSLPTYAIPTPFSKRPFEFAIGFRKTYLLLFVLYTLGVIGMVVGNYNLGLFSLFCLFLLTMNYYSTPEPPFYVWIHSVNAHQFLQMKVKQSILHSLILVSPLALLLMILNPVNAYIVAIILVTGLLYTVTWVLGKYAIYPKEADLPQIIKMALGIFMPPLILILIPHFYFKSLVRLTTYLK
ncbi:hypothetical protein [Xanthocytophaga agilis]|uniref:Uncharacterized protein n=1 Tax=Xanthocytophaga agilis TaxID=3048010 RepID=A0AAE3R499_9BACT|nr:hypothetical protein [Xanthocytophaga agilis]MDJ1501274.1 hypothetical protein [Xanthocytophaga agilis]